MVLGKAHDTKAYGKAAASVLRLIEEPAAKLSQAFADHLYDALEESPRTAELLDRLSADEFAVLRTRQARHFVNLLTPEFTEADHLAAAEKAGRAHAFVGVDLLWLIEAFGLYLHNAHEMLCPLVKGGRERELLMRVLSRRILMDMEGQVSAYRKIDVQTAEVLAHIDHLLLTAANLADLVRGTMASIGELEGLLCVFFGRADGTGELQIEASFGVCAERYHQAMEAGVVPKISIDAQVPAGQGPGGRAWRDATTQVTDSWMADQRLRPWATVGVELGFRSSAAIPLLNASGRPLALLSLYSAWPGFFSTIRMRSFLAHVQRGLGHAVERMEIAVVIPLRDQQWFRKLLDEERLVIVYQPIIDLRTGALSRLEALARLRGDDGELISPARFLPAFGDVELLKLFKQGLAQIQRDAKAFETAGLTADFSINFPAEGLRDVRYEQALFAATDRSGFDLHRLQLEILETEESGGRAEQSQAFLLRLREKGIRLAQDDLGAGHSSLLRMDRYHFDEVKIDQALVGGALHQPQRALEFILYLVRLAHAFGTLVVVEGLENLGMMEAAAILGADYGQGYGIARPMAAEAVVEWQKSYRYPLNPQQPQTALGAMAGYLLWDLQMAMIGDQADPFHDFHGARSIVGRFVASNGLQESPLGEWAGAMPPSTPQVGGTTEPDTRSREMARVLQKVRVEVLQQLAEHWLKEIGD